MVQDILDDFDRQARYIERIEEDEPWEPPFPDPTCSWECARKDGFCYHVACPWFGCCWGIRGDTFQVTSYEGAPGVWTDGGEFLPVGE